MILFIILSMHLAFRSLMQVRTIKLFIDIVARCGLPYLASGNIIDIPKECSDRYPFYS